ncbi:MAG: hypothetical protein C0403_09215 [Desulfobacterium sp.]|nr:hypothetical protein [Desulfobacterium sp.]
MVFVSSTIRILQFFNNFIISGSLKPIPAERVDQQVLLIHHDHPILFHDLHTSKNPNMIFHI